MSELIERLLAEETDLTDCAADRIEELERGMDALQDRLDTANKARADANFRANENQFKLAEAVEALQDMVAVAEQDGWHKAITGRQMILRNARTTLAELEGGE
jgi:hypothetical protein